MRPLLAITALLFFAICVHGEYLNNPSNFEDSLRVKRGRYFGGLSSAYGTEIDIYDSLLASADAIPMRHNRGHYYGYNALLKKPITAARMVRPRLF